MLRTKKLSYVLLSFLIAAAVALTLFFAPAFAHGTVAKAEEDEIYWRVTANNELIISSTEAAADSTEKGRGKQSEKPWTFWSSSFYDLKSVKVDGTVKAPADIKGWFSNKSEITDIDLRGLDTSAVTDMGSMFGDCSSLSSLNLTGLNTSAVTNMTSMFYGCASLTSLDVSGFDTANVENMQFMFGGCSSLISLDLSNFDTGKVKNMMNMFSGCTSLTTLDVSGFTIRNDHVSGTEMYPATSMFENCSSLISLDLSGFNMDTANHWTAGGMLRGLDSLESIKISEKIALGFSSFGFGKTLYKNADGEIKEYVCDEYGSYAPSLTAGEYTTADPSSTPDPDPVDPTPTPDPTPDPDPVDPTPTPDPDPTPDPAPDTPSGDNPSQGETDKDDNQNNQGGTTGGSQSGNDSSDTDNSAGGGTPEKSNAWWIALIVIVCVLAAGTAVFFAVRKIKK